MNISVNDYLSFAMGAIMIVTIILVGMYPYVGNLAVDLCSQTGSVILS